MKKIIALVLVIVSVFTLAACSLFGNKAVEAIAEMQANSDPTKVIINTEQTYGVHKLIGEATFVKGTCDGKRAMVYVENYQDMSEIEDQAGNPFESTKVTYEYLEGRGVRVDGGRWDASRTDFSYNTNVIDLNIASDYLTEVVEDGNKITAVIPSSAVDAVFGDNCGIDSDVTISITNDGVVITAITLNYTVAAPSTIESDLQVSISAVYSYDAETVEIAQ